MHKETDVFAAACLEKELVLPSMCSLCVAEAMFYCALPGPEAGPLRPGMLWGCVSFGRICPENSLQKVLFSSRQSQGAARTVWASPPCFGPLQHARRSFREQDRKWLKMVLQVSLHRGLLTNNIDSAGHFAHVNDLVLSDVWQDIRLLSWCGSAR